MTLPEGIQSLKLSMIALLIFTSAGIACKDGKNDKDTNGTKEVVATREPVFEKLVGTWQSENGKTFERWSTKENGAYRSVVFSINGKDTLWNEQADIYKENGRWIFSNSVKGQNENKPVKFIAISLSAVSVHFNNPSHDFPTDINYTLTDGNTLRAFIVGPNGKGGKDTIPFNYTRLRNAY